MRNVLLLVAAILFVSESSFAQETTGAPQTPTAAANTVMKLDDATPVLLRRRSPWLPPRWGIVFRFASPRT
jgi:hypothetical protein